MIGLMHGWNKDWRQIRGSELSHPLKDLRALLPVVQMLLLIEFGTSLPVGHGREIFSFGRLRFRGAHFSFCKHISEGAIVLSSKRPVSVVLPGLLHFVFDCANVQM